MRWRFRGKTLRAKIGPRPNVLERKLSMEDFPIWLKLLVWLIIGGTVVYVVVAILSSGLNG